MLREMNEILTSAKASLNELQPRIARLRERL
jgi:hypothetical protein